MLDSHDIACYILELTTSKFMAYSKNLYIRTQKLRTSRLKFSVMHHLNKNLLQPQHE